MAKLTSRERIKIALDHREADKVPIDFGGMRSTGISAIAYNKLKEYLGLKGETYVYDIFQQLAEPEKEIINIMGGDVVQLHRYAPAFGISLEDWEKGKLKDGSDCLYPKEFNPKRYEDGSLNIMKGNTVIAKMPQSSYYFDQVYHPYEKVETKDDIDKISLPEISNKEIKYLKTEAKKLYEETDKAILGEFLGNIFEAGQMDWGYEKYFMKLSLNKELMHYYHQRLTAAYMGILKKYLDTVGEYIDIIHFGDDLGTQETTQISVDMYREMIKPYHKKMFRYVHNNYPDIKVFFHSCGAIYDLIPDLIDAGVEILNPIQLSAKKMDPNKLKKEFGKDLVFWGGGIDTQTTLTNKSITEIKNEVKKLINIFAPGGGFVFTQVHNIQANIPPKKIMAVYETANKYGKYPIKHNF